MRVLPLALLALTFTTAAFAQSPADALRAEAKTLALKDVPDDYRAVIVGGSSDITPWLLLGAFGGGSNNKPSEALLFRSLGATWVQPDEFAELLDGKRPRIRGYRLDFAGLVNAGSNATPTFAESWLESGRIVTWSPAPELSKTALAKAFAEANRPVEPTEVGTAPVAVGAEGRLSSVKEAATAILIYTADYDDRLPKAEASSQLAPAIGPYLKNAAVLADSPEGGRLLYNTHLSGVPTSRLAAPSETLLLWEERAWPDGRRSVAFVDGHATRVDNAEWNRLWDAELARRAKSRGE